jgi:membrane protein DedA with SNARE-associated domain
METLTTIFETYGYGLLLLVGFAEFIGVPIASVPVLVGAGALAAGGGPNLMGVAGAAALGGFLADAGWYSLARWKGSRLVGAACGLSSNPRACVVGVEDRVTRLGSLYVLSAKFLPGAANLVAPAAGYAGFSPVRFLALDAVALIAWASVYSTLGWLLSGQVETLIVATVAYSRWALLSALVLMGAAGAWRFVKMRIHQTHHPTVERLTGGAAASGPSSIPASAPAKTIGDRLG